MSCLYVHSSLNGMNLPLIPAIFDSTHTNISPDMYKLVKITKLSVLEGPLESSNPHSEQAYSRAAPATVQGCPCSLFEIVQSGHVWIPDHSANGSQHSLKQVADMHLSLSFRL